MGVVEAANVEESKGTWAVLQQRLEEDLLAEIIYLEDKPQPHRLVRVGIEYRLIEVAAVNELTGVRQFTQGDLVQAMTPLETAGSLEGDIDVGLRIPAHANGGFVVGEGSAPQVIGFRAKRDGWGPVHAQVEAVKVVVGNAQVVFFEAVLAKHSGG